MSNKSKVPVYDGQMSYAKYVRKVEKFKIALSNEKYNLVLEFINTVFQLELKSVLEFKSVDEDDILKATNESLLKFKNSFKDVLSVKINSKPKKEKYVIYVLTKALAKIGYTLTCNSSSEYTVKRRSEQVST